MSLTSSQESEKSGQPIESPPLIQQSGSELKSTPLELETASAPESGKPEEPANSSSEQSEKPEKPPIPGPPPLADLLEVGMEEEIAKEEVDRLAGRGSSRFPLSPSQFGACSRLLAINLAETIGLGQWPLELLDARAKRRFSRGYDIEYSLIKQLKKYVPIAQGFGQQYLTMDLTQDGKYVIGGSMDTLFMSEEHMIVDIKSKATYFSSYMSDSFEETFDSIRNMPGVKEFGNRAFFIEDIDGFYERFTKDDFMSRYFLQLNAYGACDWARDFRSNMFPGVVGVSAVALLFENKNNHIMAEVRWKPSRTLYDFAIQRMKAIYQYVAIDKKDPLQYRADFTLGSLACRLCPRKANCWGDTRHPYTGPKKKWAKDADRLHNFDALENKYAQFRNLLTSKDEHDKVEQELITEMVNSGEQKIRFADGKIWETRELKSPKPHFVLRRSK
jgi:hypothetical protein